MNLIGPPSAELLQFDVNTLRDVVTLTFDLSTLESCHVMPLGWSIPIPCLRWIWYTVTELGWLQFSIDRQLSPNFYVFGGRGQRGSNFKFHHSNPQKALPWPERRIMAYCAWWCVQRSWDATCGLGEETKKDRNFHASNWLYLLTPPTSM